MQCRKHPLCRHFSWIHICILAVVALLILLCGLVPDNFRQDMIRDYSTERHRIPDKGMEVDNVQESFYEANGQDRVTFLQNNTEKSLDWEKVQSLRRKQIQRACHSNHNYQTNFESILVDESHRLLYCVIPKVACTNWKRLLLYWTGNTNVSTPEEIRGDTVHNSNTLIKYGLKYLSKYSVLETKRKLDRYFKFIMVRHPLERLLSAYRNKFTVKNKYNVYFHKKYGRSIIRHFRQNPSNTSLKTGDDVRFIEFIQYLINHETVDKSERRNAHWRPYIELCNPCAIKYDIIGKFETMHDDVRYLMNRIGENNSTFPNILSRETYLNEKWREAYSILTSEQFDQLIDIYRLDFQLFGYEIPNSNQIVQNKIL